MKIVAIDVETTGLEYNDSLLTISVAYRNEDGSLFTKGFTIGMADLFYQPDPPPLVMQELKTLVEKNDLVALHNASFDLPYLDKQKFLPIQSVKHKLLDTLVTARMTAPRNNGLNLEAVCNDYGITDSQWAEMKEQRKNLSTLDVESVLQYNQTDAKYTLLLAEKLWEDSVKLYGKDFTLRESDFSRLMAEVRIRGKKIHIENTQRKIKEIKLLLNHIYFEILGERGIVGAYDKSGLIKWMRIKGFSGFNLTEKGNEKLDKNELQELSKVVKEREMREVLEAVLEARKLEKLIGTYLNPILNEHLDVEGYIHPSFVVGGTTTYRLSSSHPNGQNMPREFSDVIFEEYLSADYSQAELRLAAAFARETKLAEIFSEGRDVHLETAIQLYGNENAKEMRPTAKNGNFCVLYGGSYKTLSERYQVDLDDARKFIQGHRRLYPRLHQMTRQAAEVWKEKGYVTLLSGKRLWATKDDLQREYKGFNNVIQGGVAELIKESMLQLDERDVIIIGQTHDEISFPLGEDKETIRNVMENVLPETISNRTNPPIKMEVHIDVKGAKNE